MLEITEVTRKDALCGLSLKIQDNGIYGVLTADEKARNALADILCGCENAEDGQVLITGEVMSRTALELKKSVRLVPKSIAADKSTTPVEYMDFIGQALGVDTDKRYRQIKEALELMAIEKVQNRLFSSLSTAELLRVSVASALIGNPDVIVLNDPFGGIGEKELGEIYEILTMLGSIKTLVLICHKVAPVKALCRDMAILCGGKVVLEGNISEIEDKINSTRELHISVRGEYERVRSAIEGVDSVVGVKLMAEEKNNVNKIRVEHKPDTKIKDRLFSALSAVDAPMLSFKPVILTLEDVFYSLTEKDRKKQKMEDEPNESRI